MRRDGKFCYIMADNAKQPVLLTLGWLLAAGVIRISGAKNCISPLEINNLRGFLKGA